MNRKGDWIQLFLVAFFFLLLVIAVALLFAERDNLEVERPQLHIDTTHARAQALLTNILRLPAEHDVNGDGSSEEISLAVLLSANTGAQDDMVLALFRESLAGPWYYKLVITYPNRTLELQNASMARLVEFAHLGKATMELPSVTVSLEMTGEPKSADEREFERLVRQSQTRTGGGLG